jgi:uncharacterized protein YacL
MRIHQKAVQALPRFRMFHRNSPLQLTMFPFAATMEMRINEVSMEKVAVGIFGAVGALLVVAFVALLSALPVMFLWNWLMPELFGLRVIDFWQALGLSMLCGALFKSSGSSSAS